MYKKQVGFKTHIIRIGIIFVLVSFLFILPAGVSAGTMQWTTVNTPANNNNVIVSPSEINFITVAPGGILFATDVPHSKVYRSQDGGISWQDISSYLINAGATLPAWNIEAAPDMAGIVAVVTSTGGQPRNVFVSFDGGENWQNLNCPAANNICSLAISRNYGANDIAVGTRNGAGGGNLLTSKLTGPGNWFDQGITGDVISARFSPSYNGDNTIVVVTANAAGSFVNLGIRDVVANSTNWATWGPVEITIAGSGSSPKANQIKTADIELPLDFQGQSSFQRRIYVNTDDGGATGSGGIYRIDDAVPYKIMPPNGNKMISSISYYGSISSGKLMAGEVKGNATLATADIWVCVNAAQNCPMVDCLLWQRAAKPPTGGANSGNANAQVYWNIDGVKSYCGTSSADLIAGGWPNGYNISQALDESAFSYAIDNASTWNQISLIDTQLSFLADVVSTLNADTLYLASINTNGGLTGFDSIWRGTGYPLFKTWERIMCPLVSSNDIILRSDLTKPAQIYTGFRSTNILYRSTDRGQLWKETVPNINITDFQAVDVSGTPNLFVLSNNNLRRGQFDGSAWHWEPTLPATLLSGYSLTATPYGVIVLGDTAGGVAYSTNFGLQFTLLPSLPVTGNIRAIVDTRITNHILIYAATDDPASNIYNIVADASTSWLAMSAPQQQYYGLVQLGTFYGAWSSGGNSGVSRTLNPESRGEPFIEWSNLTSGLPAGVAFTRQPSSLKASAGINLWAIDNNNYTANTGRLWQFLDGLAIGPVVIAPPEYSENLLQPPIPVVPANDALIPLDIKTGGTPSIEFKWKHNTEANGYDLWIAADSAFSQPVSKQSIRPQNVMAPSFTLATANSPLQPGETYYWKVRVNRVAGTYQKAEGSWSETMTFSLTAKNIPQGPKPVPVLLSPEDQAILPAGIINFSWESISEATLYQFSLYGDKEMTDLIVDTSTPASSYRFTGQLEEGHTYYWSVKVMKPYISESSPVFSFSIGEEQGSQPPQPVIFEFPMWIYIIIGVAVVLVIAVTVTIVLLTRKRK